MGCILLGYGSHIIATTNNYSGLINRGGPGGLMIDTMVLVVLCFASICMAFYLVAFCWIGCAKSSSVNSACYVPLCIFGIGILPLLICGPLGITKDRKYRDFVEKNLNGSIDIYGHSRNDGIELDYYKCLTTTEDMQYDWCALVTKDWDELQEFVSYSGLPCYLEKYYFVALLF